ncbi:MAG: carboxynorspermidine decarboxylase [Muribaculaceae bacterium]|nr:carboxynorspermidine decarboxylase [Muribaculaceae bacterium]
MNTINVSHLNIPTPFYIVYEDRLRRNLSLIKEVEKRAGVKIIMALKANALWKTFPIISEYISSSTASSLNEMRLSLEYLGKDVHTYCPVYTEESFSEFLIGSSHITFNSLSQFNRFYPVVKDFNDSLEKMGKNKVKVSCGLRVNPLCSVIETDLYNPCLPGSRFGVQAKDLPDNLPEGFEGFHFHALCESSSFDLEKVLIALDEQFGKWLPHLKWLNMGGGHLMTRKDYDIDHLVGLLLDFKRKYPNLELIMEPGSAFTWQTGDLITKVLDVVENSGVNTAIIDASFACHMPDCLEMPYRPNIEEAVPDSSSDFRYRLGGNSCLSGDFVDGWNFPSPLKPGDVLTLKDMNHYTTVKTHMFNGIQHPSIWLKPLNGEPVKLREFTYEDYKSRMD